MVETRLLNRETKPSILLLLRHRVRQASGLLLPIHLC